MKGTMATDKGSSAGNNPLEQFVLLAKSAKGAAAVELVKQVLEAPGVHVFGELLDMPNVVELENGPHANYYHALHLFAYGTYRQYLENKAKLLELTPVQKKKLQHLTIVTLATKNKCIPYAVLLQELDIKNVRDLEDLIIEAIYADIIHGKLDQKHSQLEVDYAIGRDIQPADLGSIVSTLQDWCDSCEAVLSCVETQINRANAEKNRRLKHKEAIEQEIINIKKTLKTQSQDPDEAMATDSREAVAQGGDKGKKPIKAKGLRGSSKFWQKS
ncbi:COP9 signalosome complex subunit 7a [Cryptotermes secundus]|uniref:COP9 signalosome complex subunit 7a n=1 Tax=Cryptotermes secundus TaxID=105785 RepID=A0A2J7QS97_9NEOP|nr:COP9 signalosome complex subunit 7a [Cryptotermes secundus]XP_023709728.1 COP9 signalosome complex subunit 7a [Cryptotermes secundus]XP_023709729.1 COP9 signalosome complex subunit 7a [Cryptotermes secundus]PNF31470.1 COP9 signalosome complex subunit 7a [Cryptotermes secundus]PNF31471.1 COP9 signalosome complex subunit 7a [Cryptotermes secundus]PNF31472.1 COP9 signalosome complex subunit 7a [Cryptotermes secundus]